jgi:hypothetical protein
MTKMDNREQTPIGFETNSIGTAIASYALLVMLTGGCSGQPAADGPTKADGHGDQNQKHRIDDYIVRMSPLLQEHGFPNVKMTPVDENGIWRIIVVGEVASQSQRGTEDNRIVLESVLHASQPPAEVRMDVQYRIGSGGG